MGLTKTHLYSGVANCYTLGEYTNTREARIEIQILRESLLTARLTARILGAAPRLLPRRVELGRRVHLQLEPARRVERVREAHADAGQEETRTLLEGRERRSAVVAAPYIRRVAPVERVAEDRAAQRGTVHLRKVPAVISKSRRETM